MTKMRSDPGHERPGVHATGEQQGDRADNGRPVEREIKLAADPGLDLPDLRQASGGTQPLPDQHTLARYFDTTDLRLWRRSITLRHRVGESPGEGTWTLKLPLEDGEPTLDRTELSWPGGPDSVPTPATTIVRGVVRDGALGQIAELEATRRRLVLGEPAGEAWGEIDDDTVTVIAPGGPAPDGTGPGGPAPDGAAPDGAATRFRQIEVELTGRGRPDLDAVVDQLLAAGARPDGEPKLGKALRLAGYRPVAGGPPALDRHSSMDEVAEWAIGNGVAILLDHDVRLRLHAGEPATRDIHHARVATRRLRSDLKMLSDQFDPGWLVPVRRELSWLGGVLGRVRDADVLRSVLLSDEAVSEAGETLELRQRLDDDRRAAAADLASAMDDDRYLALLDLLESASTRPPLRIGGNDEQKNDEQEGSTRKPTRSGWGRKVLPRLLRKRLSALERTVRSAGPSPSDAQLHRIRIRAKQLRYTAETATPVLGKAARRIATDAEALQSVLGDHHDSVAAEQWLRHQALTGSRGTVFSAGILVARERRRQEELRGRWPAVWDHLDAERARRSLG